MSQVTHGVRTLLSYSKVYDLFQNIMGAKRGRLIFASQYIRAKHGDRVLDIGCGTAEIRDFLPQLDYYGFDPNSQYIEAAKNRLNNISGCTLVRGTVDEVTLSELPKFDIVIAIGVLHHLNDEAAIQLANLAKVVLKKGGRLVTLDPCFVKGQSPIAKFLASRDRGQHVRNLEGYRDLLVSVFDSINTEIRHDLAYFPYTHLITESTA